MAYCEQRWKLCLYPQLHIAEHEETKEPCSTLIDRGQGQEIVAQWESQLNSTFKYFVLNFIFPYAVIHSTVVLKLYISH